MNYKLTILKLEPNEKYQEELEKMNNRYSHSVNDTYPEKEKVTRQLEVSLNEDEFKAIKKSVLETFK